MSHSPKALLASLVLVSTSFAAEGGPIAHEVLRCIPVDSSARVLAGTTAAQPVSSARVYFRPEGVTFEYFVEMRRATGDNWVGFLPAASSAETAIVYRVEMKDADGLARRTSPTRVQASTSCPIAMSAEETRMSKNLILGLTAAGQPVVPTGFSAVGIVARISPEGDLQTLPPGSAETAYGGAPVSPVASRTGPSPACVGCGTLTIGGTTTVGVGDCVIGCGPPPPISSVRPPSGRK